jgi:hypothetical protein
MRRHRLVEKPRIAGHLHRHFVAARSFLVTRFVADRVLYLFSRFSGIM